MKTADTHQSIDPQPTAQYVKKISLNDIVNVRQPRPNTQQPSWFSALRSRLSQLTMPEWLSQLGIGASQSQQQQQQQHQQQTNNNRHSVAIMPIPEDNATLDSNIFGKDTLEMSKESPIVHKTLTRICDRKALSLDDAKDNTDAIDWLWDVNGWNGQTEQIDTLKQQHFGPLSNLALERQDPGRGHSFVELSMSHPTWCDKCGDFMWGILTTAVKCENCNYTCHEKCKSLVTLDCKDFDRTIKSNQSDEFSTAQSALNLYPKLQTIIHEDKQQPTSKLESEVPLSSSSQERNYSGCIQIHMNFIRPINVVAGETFPSIFDVRNGTASSTSGRRTITSFFLPRNTVKTVHIRSEMTTREMIVILLRKFKVADNPRKFSLYERICDVGGEFVEGKDLIRVPDDAHPLRIARSWQQLNQCRQFVLQENDTGDILWEMFEIPELENFLRILGNEENQYIFHIRQKYNTYSEQIDQQLYCRGYYTEKERNSSGTAV